MFWILLIVAVSTFLYYFLMKPFRFWTDRGVKQGKPMMIFGDSWGTLTRKQCFAELVQDLYNMCPGTRYSGTYQLHLPSLILKDADLIKQITVKDFDHFTNHTSLIPDDVDPLWGRNLFMLKGKRWRDMRTTLSPAFTSSKMRSMFVLITQVADNFVNYFNAKGDDVIEVEMKDTFTRFANDVIATTAFGIEVDSLSNQNNEFYLMGKAATDFSGWRKALKFFGFFIIPKIYKYFNVTFAGEPVNRFFINIVRETIRTREEKGIVRPDMIQLLMEARKDNLKQDESSELLDAGFATVQEASSEEQSLKIKMDITDTDIAAQALIFFFAGFDPVSALMCFMAHELAANPDIQTKLRAEIVKTFKETGEKFTYEALLKMTYMDMVVSETLRKWPTAIAIDRICNKPYTIVPVREDECALHLEVGAAVWVPVFGIHRDPEIYPNPEQFDPERFSDENKTRINPYLYLPFGVGPRNCIGSRFALLETKALFFYILNNFEIVPVKKTKIPLQLSKTSTSMSADGGFWLGLKRLKN